MFKIGLRVFRAQRHLRKLPHHRVRISSEAVRYPEPIFREFEPSVAAALLEDGYAVIDDAISSSTAALLRDELEALSALDGALRPNQTHFVGARAADDEPLLLSKPNVYEAEMHTASPEALAVAPTLARMSHDSSLAALLSCYAPSLTLLDTAVKAQVNAGAGGCFPIHVDSDASVDKRLVTGLLYPNACWDASHGGLLRLYPFPRPPSSAPRHVDIAPAHRRLVLLSSTEMHHRVLPSHARRYCVTLWLSGRVSARGRRAQTPPPDCAALRDVLRAPRYRRHAARIALSPAWEASLRDAHGGDSGAVQAHRADVARLAEALEAEIMARFAEVDADRLREVLRSPEALDEELAWREDEAREVQWIG